MPVPVTKIVFGHVNLQELVELSIHHGVAFDMRPRDENAIAHDVFDGAERAEVLERIFRGHDHVGALAHLERSLRQSCRWPVDLLEWN